jgi:hypothetical protein
MTSWLERTVVNEDTVARAVAVMLMLPIPKIREK